MTSKTIVLIHGNFFNYQCWDPWVARYEARGYRCLAIAYPGRDKTVAELRAAHPDPSLGELTIEQVTERCVQTIRSLEEPPIIIGHSFGGLLTQLMLDRGLGAAGVAIDSVPPQGILSTEPSFLRSTWPLLNPFTPASRPYLMPFSHFRYAFVNGMPLEEQRRAYDERVVPESLRLVRGGLSAAARVDFKKERPPLLLIGGELDHIMPASINKANYQRSKASPSQTAIKVFSERNHFGIGAPGWEEIADYALDWAVKAAAGVAQAEERRNYY